MIISVKKSLNYVINTLFPRLCNSCGEQCDSILEICAACEWHLPWVIDACRRCGLPAQTNDDWRDCTRCRENQPYFDRVCALFYYHSPIKQMITQLKFSRRLSVAHGLGALFASKMEDYGYTKDRLPEVILPMPLHPKRLRKRGYNQAYELSDGLLKYKSNAPLGALSIPINDRLCWRVKSTAAQSGLDKNARQKNIAGAFAISPAIAYYKHVAIFDDVMTTGATVNALSLALKEAGVEQVDVWCICRA